MEHTHTHTQCRLRISTLRESMNQQKGNTMTHQEDENDEEHIQN